MATRVFGHIAADAPTVHLAPNEPERGVLCRPYTQEELTEVQGQLTEPGFGEQCVAALLVARVAPDLLCRHCFPRELRRKYVKLYD